MTRVSLRHTTAFRMAMCYAAFFCLLTTACLAALYWLTTSALDAQIDAGLRAETAALVRLEELKGAAALKNAVAERSTRPSLAASDTGDTGPRQYLLADARGTPLAGTLGGWPRELGGAADGWATLALALPADQPGLDEDGPRVRVRLHMAALPDGYRLLVGQALNETDELRATLFAITLGAVLLTLVVGFAGGALMGRGVVRRLEQVTSAADTIMEGDLSRRIFEEGGRGEFDALAQKLNAMLARIEELMRQSRETTENVAHDLRSPLGRLRTRLEAMTRSGRAKPEEIARAIEETDRIVATLNAILGIAEIGSRTRSAWTRLDLGALCHDVLELYAPVAEEKRVALTSDIAEGASAQGNRQLLAQAVSNLLDNAVKYTPAGGRVSLELKQEAGRARIAVADSGPGIPVELRGKVLERFVRLDASRSQPGNGLGLSLVAAVAAHHGAELKLEDNHPGLRAVILLPAA